MEKNPNTTLNEILRAQPISLTLEEWQSVMDAHRVAAEAIQTISERLVALEKAHKALQDVVLMGNIMYRPEGEENHLNMKSNLDLIYSKLKALENGV